MPTPPDYLVRVRQNSTLNLLAEVDDYTHATVNPRFNDIGTWVLDISKTSPWASYLTSFANGVIFERDIHDGNGYKAFLSGPITKVRRKGGPEQMLQISGSSDEQVLADREGLPVVGYPFANFWANSVNQKRFYALNEASGTVATDSSPGATNGTYTGAFTYSQPGLIDDPSTCVKFNGSTTEVGVPTAGLSAGNSAFTVFAWGMLSANPGADVYLWTHGTNAAAQGAGLFINSSGLPGARILGGTGSVIGGTAITPNVPFLLAMTWDGTTFTGFYNGQSIGTLTPGALNITYGFARIGDLLGVSNFWPGWGGMVGFANTNFNTNPTNQIATMYANGVNRVSFSATDVQLVGMGTPGPFTNASTALIYYAQRNASTTASPYAGYGSALPASAFTSALLAQAARPIPLLTCAADPLVGSLTYASARFINLLKLEQVLALQSTPELGFRVVQVGSALQFQVYQPVDQTANAKFSTDLGNLFSYEWELSRPTANHFWIGGAGTGSTRVFTEVEDATSVATYGRIEGFVDRRSVSDVNTLKGYGQAELARQSSQSNLTIQPQDTDSLQVFRDYNLGDKVAAITEDGNTVTDLIRGLQIELDPNNILVTPAIGSPSQGEINATLLLLRKKLIQVQDLLDQVQGGT